MKEKMICRGDLFYYDFGDNSGSVQSGERPVLVVQADDYNQNAPTIIVAAVTSVIKKRYLPSHIILGEEFGLKKPSMVLLEQMEYMGFESTQAVYKWEAGKCYPQADNLVALAILYNVSPMELLVEEDRVSSSSCLWGNLFVA